MARIHVLNQVIFKNRQDAGELLAEHVRVYRGKNVLILGLSRGGIVVARTVAKMLNIPFDVLVVKKLSSPYEPELAIGALAPDGSRSGVGEEEAGCQNNRCPSCCIVGSNEYDTIGSRRADSSCVD